MAGPALPRIGPAMEEPAAPGAAERLTLAEAVARRTDWRRAGLCVVLTNGCFDLLHAGHVAYLRSARRLGDVLVVALNDDTSAAVLKGAGRPITTLDERAEILCALRMVDAVVPFGGRTAEGVVRALVPDVYVKGGDYDERRHRPPEADVAVEVGARIAFLPYVRGASTSELIARIRGQSR
jgi:rfaE bifunctional protein nucleotidyltransferase chain/domain